MRGVNKVTLLGRLGADPQVNQNNNGMVVNINVATSEQWNDKNGNRQERTEWHRVTFFGKLAEIAAKYLTKGSIVYVEGKLRTERYTDKQNIERFSTGIYADELQMIGGNNQNQNGQQPQGNYQQPMFDNGNMAQGNSQFTMQPQQPQQPQMPQNAGLPNVSLPNVTFP